MKLPDNEGFNFPTHIFGGVYGTIGVIASIPADK